MTDCIRNIALSGHTQLLHSRKKTVLHVTIEPRFECNGNCLCVNGTAYLRRVNISDLKCNTMTRVSHFTVARRCFRYQRNTKLLS